MPVIITLKSYLAKLEAVERSRPEGQRREVPTLTELAEAAGTHRVPFNRIANGDVKRLNLDTVDKVIAEMRRRGFPMNLDDFMIYQD